MSSSAQSWVEDHKLTTIGAAWATAVGASVAYSRRRKRAAGLRLVTLAVLGGGAALAHHYYGKSSRKKRDDFDYDFYSQLPAATDADGQENERQSW